MLETVEEAARGQQVTRLRLDTGSHLTEARQLYIKNGYQEVPPFNEGRVFDLWYEKSVT